MIIKKIDVFNFTESYLFQMEKIENECGLIPYDKEMLCECVLKLDTFAAIKNDEILGYITVNGSTKYFEGSLYIVNINVKNDYKRQKIGTKLMEYIYNYYKDKITWEYVTLDVEKTNPAIHFYNKLGFNKINVPSRNGDTDIVMAINFVSFGKNFI